MTTAVEERFFAKVSLDPVGECWLWIACHDRHGYGRFTVGSRRDGTRRVVFSHRWAYEFLVGEIPEGLQLDHVREHGCRSTLCVNPAHLEPTTGRVNVLRGDTFAACNVAKERCPRGHLYDEANTYWHGAQRHCRTCRCIRERVARAVRKGDDHGIDQE